MEEYTSIKYFVCETDEYVEPKNPNLFRITKPLKEIKLKEIKERFSDWKGGFRFYFKTLENPNSSNNNDDQFVWEDITDENQCPLPTFKGNIIFKAVRTGFKQFFEIKTRERNATSKAMVLNSPRESSMMKKKQQIAPTTPRNNSPSPSSSNLTAEEESLLESLTKETHFTTSELKAMFIKFKRETPSLQIDKPGFVKFTKGMGIEDEFLQDLIFNKFDEDKSGAVDFSEFMKGLSIISRGTPDEKLQSAFEMYDINGDGHIAKEEFERILTSFIKYKGGSITTASGKIYNKIEDVCDDFFKLLDVDGDGEISFEDYKVGAKNNPDITSFMKII